MATTTIKIDIEDIETSRIGNNIFIKMRNDLNLAFTSEALEELISDYKGIIRRESNVPATEKNNLQCPDCMADVMLYDNKLILIKHHS